MITLCFDSEAVELWTVCIVNMQHVAVKVESADDTHSLNS